MKCSVVGRDDDLRNLCIFEKSNLGKEDLYTIAGTSDLTSLESAFIEYYTFPNKPSVTSKPVPSIDDSGPMPVLFSLQMRTQP
ncbi:hypothetical protein TNIN_81761 [Trichonephila inaurata madagascariensis]|uniref:Uncharacterized protein n=1 Tax=Trichonephila inaurata madagascariensis TaxID=2747483 RepID=A0A8X6INN2_9ARAC|nr:hypothetical protein TNIN_81761 [Trichonephila inaurata madagascariensis]